MQHHDASRLNSLSFIGIVCAIGLSSSAQAATTISLPKAGSAVPGLVQVTAASSDAGVLNLQVWEGSIKYGFQDGKILNQSYSIPQGPHTLSVISVASNNRILSQSTVSFFVGAAGSGVTSVSAPLSGSAVQSPVHVVATSGNLGVENLQVWEGPTKYGFQAGSSLNANYAMAAGPHTLTVLSVGADNLILSKSTVSFTVGSVGSTSGSGSGSGGTISIPVPPPNAVVLDNLQQIPFSQWHQPCTGPCSACPPDDQDCLAQNANYTYYQAKMPFSDGIGGALGDLFELFTGPTLAPKAPWGSVVFGLSLASMDPEKQNFTWASNFIEDFEFQVNNDNPQALEWDFWQAVGGTKYMFGNQCVYPTHEWDGWNEVTGHWVKSEAPCPALTPGSWHHVVMSVQRANGGTHYNAVQIDGTTYPTGLSEPGAPNSGWGNSIGVQFQLDYNYSLGNPAPGYIEYLEHLKVTAW